MEREPRRIPLAIRLAEDAPSAQFNLDFGRYDNKTQMSENGLLLAATTTTGTTSGPGGPDQEHDAA